ncbi:hypothetical protein AK812_SmicGene43941 [Symbiodinium microadriaticum]|uniref:Uncharacterized protein n=1 Tax=Symbiodinium microadriaticum TaxID=2951 RepID=A0A1Q9BZZ4_SYMMI|nr:hypothetical protein AK812_SmicGene43941 [Symbiodinium microadriaticum]
MRYHATISLGAKIRPVARTSTSLVSPARQGFSPSLVPRSSSPAGPRHTTAELTSAPPQRAVQLSPTPMRAPATGQTAIQAPSPPKLPARLSGSASARLTPSIPGQVSSPAPRVYNVVRSVHASPHTQATVRVVSNIQGTTSAPASVQWTTPRPGPDRPLTPVAGVVQRVTPPPLAAMRKSATGRELLTISSSSSSSKLGRELTIKDGSNVSVHGDGAEQGGRGLVCRALHLMEIVLLRAFPYIELARAKGMSRRLEELRNFGFPSPHGLWTMSMPPLHLVASTFPVQPGAVSCAVSVYSSRIGVDMEIHRNVPTP